jgi:hypothetical protein
MGERWKGLLVVTASAALVTASVAGVDRCAARFEARAAARHERALLDLDLSCCPDGCPACLLRGACPPQLRGPRVTVPASLVPWACKRLCTRRAIAWHRATLTAGQS